jgi:hypothetical protein
VLLLLRFTISINVLGCAGILRLVVKESCGGEVVERSEKSETRLGAKRVRGVESTPQIAKLQK